MESFPKLTRTNLRLHSSPVLTSLSSSSYWFFLRQNLERAANQQKAELEHLSEQLGALRQQTAADREALKRATRAQKQRAERSEDTAEQLASQLLDMVGPRPRGGG